MRRRQAFSLFELIVVVAIMGVFSGAMWYAFSGTVRGLTTTGDHQVALRNALLLSTSLDQDMRALAVLNERRDDGLPYPLSPYTIVFSPARTSVRMRVSAPIESLEADPASRFSIVTYQLVESKNVKGAYALRRDERTASGKPLPGDRTDRRSHTFEDLTVAGLRFRFVAWLVPYEWRQYITMHLTTTEGQTPEGQPRAHSITRQFDVAIPDPPHGGAGGPVGWALNAPVPLLASQLAGGVDIVARPGNFTPLEVPPDAVDRAGRPITLPAELPAGPVADPFVRLELPAAPLKGQFLHAAVARLEAKLGAGYRGAICGMLSGRGAAHTPVFLQPRFQDLRFRLDASVSSAKPLIQQIDELVEKVKPRGPEAMCQLLYHMQLQEFPGTGPDRSTMEQARMLIDERRAN